MSGEKSMCCLLLEPIHSRLRIVIIVYKITFWSWSSDMRGLEISSSWSVMIDDESYQTLRTNEAFV